ncbi:hypothetical protein OG963_08065 [Streptomyces sp. NBC_01707]|uniref:hypothetical protein n=1 Tax=Streptomyces sp. NBC_01707 TaxID=2975914 RepID=UPI00352E58BB
MEDPVLAIRTALMVVNPSNGQGPLSRNSRDEQDRTGRGADGLTTSANIAAGPGRAGRGTGGDVVGRRHSNGRNRPFSSRP